MFAGLFIKDEITKEEVERLKHSDVLNENMNLAPMSFIGFQKHSVFLGS